MVRGCLLEAGRVLRASASGPRRGSRARRERARRQRAEKHRAVGLGGEFLECAVEPDRFARVVLERSLHEDLTPLVSPGLSATGPN
jgi:hypothetical protein